MARPKGQLRLGAFFNPTGHHVASWRHPGAQADAGINFKHYVEIAQTAERAKFDMVFLADNICVREANMEALSRSAQYIANFEPITLISALAGVTERIGLTCTASTSYNEPYHVARKFASLDHITGGRAGWNLVTSGMAAEAKNFNRDAHFGHAERYERANEFAEIVTALWDSWDDDAFMRDKASGDFFDPEKLHMLNHKGKHFQVRGPLNIPRPPQGHPVIVQAGTSEPARKLSARVADVVFTAQSAIEDAKAFYADVKGRMQQYGRHPDDLKVMPGVAMYIGRSQQEAEEKFEYLNTLIPIEVSVSRLGRMLGGVDLSGYDLDGPMPDIESNAARVSTPLNYVRLAKRDNLTLRQVATRSGAAKDHWTLIGTPKDIADQLEHWFAEKAADGFNLLPPHVPGALNEFVDLVVPELQRRGLFRTEYEGAMLRQNLGVPYPQ